MRWREHARNDGVQDAADDEAGRDEGMHCTQKTVQHGYHAIQSQEECFHDGEAQGIIMRRTGMGCPPSSGYRDKIAGEGRQNEEKEAHEAGLREIVYKHRTESRPLNPRHR